MPEVEVELVSGGMPLSGAQELGKGAASLQNGSGCPPPEGVGSQPIGSRPFPALSEVSQLGKDSLPCPTFGESSSDRCLLADRRPQLAYRAEELRNVQLQGIGRVFLTYASSNEAGASGHVFAPVELNDEPSTLEANDSSSGQPLL